MTPARALGQSRATATASDSEQSLDRRECVCLCRMPCALNCICAQLSCFSATASMTLVIRLQTFYAPLFLTVDANANKPFSVHFMRWRLFQQIFYLKQRMGERQGEFEKGNFYAIISISNPLVKILHSTFIHRKCTRLRESCASNTKHYSAMAAPRVAAASADWFAVPEMRLENKRANCRAKRA